MFSGNNVFLGNDFHLDSWSTMLQQYHWITGWWQPRCERPLSFVEDDKLRPREDVTSGIQAQKFEMCGIKQAHSRWPTRQLQKPKRKRKKTQRTKTQPERQTSLSLTPEEIQTRLKRTKPRVVSYPKGCPGRPKGDGEVDGGLPEYFGNCMKISMFYHFRCICSSYCPLFRRFMMVQDLLDPCFAHFRSSS